MNIDFFCDLIRIPSISGDRAQVNRAMALVRDYLEARGVTCIMEDMDGLNVLYASTMPGKEQDYLLNAHLDVVPAEPELFEPRIEGERLFARGSRDCKGNAVAIIDTLCALNGKASVGAIFTADEEIGGDTTKFMIDKGYGARKLVIICDSTAYDVTVGEKGQMNLILRAYGKSGHSSRAWTCENAIDKLIDGYLKVRAAWGKNSPEYDGDIWFDTISADIVKGGTAANKVPDEAELLVNIRFTKPNDEDRITDFVRKVSGLEVERNDLCAPVFSDKDDPEIVRLRDMMARRWIDREIEFKLMCGATDARHFVVKPTPIVILGVDGDNCHAKDEYVNLPHIDELSDMLVEFMGN